MGDSSGRITLWNIEVFLATVEEGSITAAAGRLGASPSAISQQLTSLEAATGVQLLDRRGRPVSLTPAGEAFRRRAHVIRREAEQARIDLEQMDQQHLTLLRLGVIEDFDAVVTPTLLRGLAGEMVSARFLLETGPSHRLIDQLDARALDVVVAADFGTAADWMEIHPLLVEPFVMVAPAGYNLGMGNVPDLPFIQYTSRHQMGRMIADHLVRQNLRLAHRFELDSYHAILAMVAAGEGWTILTPLAVRHASIFADQVRIHLLPTTQLTRSISLTARRDMLGKVPAAIAGQLRDILNVQVIAPMLAQSPWLEPNFRTTD